MRRHDEPEAASNGPQVVLTNLSDLGEPQAANEAQRQWLEWYIHRLRSVRKFLGRTRSSFLRHVLTLLPFLIRHSNDWLFNGFSVTGAAKSLLKRRESS